jgi:hypothetical protein
MLFDQVGYVLNLERLVEDSFGLNDEDRATNTKAAGTRWDNLDLVLQTPGPYSGFEAVFDA